MNVLFKLALGILWMSLGAIFATISYKAGFNKSYNKKKEENHD